MVVNVNITEYHSYVFHFRPVSNFSSRMFVPFSPVKLYHSREIF